MPHTLARSSCLWITPAKSFPELVRHISAPTLLQTKYKELMADPTYIDGILEEGADVANETAQQTLNACKDAMGFVVPRRRS